MDPAFSNAFSPPHRHRVLGLTMRPMTVGHLLTMESSGLSITEPTTFRDLAFLAFVCSQPSASIHRSLAAWWAPLLFAAWGALWKRRDWISQVEAWEGYITESLRSPNVKTPIGAPRFETPLGVRLLAFLMRELGMTIEAAANTKVSVASCLWVAVGEMEGAVNLWTQRDQDFWEACKKLDEEALYGAA